MEMIYLAVVVSFVILILMQSKLVTRLRRNSCRSSCNLPPGPRKLPFIGNLHHLFSSLPPQYTLRDLAVKYGSVMHLQLGEIPMVVISSVEAAEQVMKTHDITFASRPSLLAIEILFYGAMDVGFAPYGDYWRNLRKIWALELMSTKRLQSFRHVREEETTNLCRWIASNSNMPINLTQKILSLNYDIILRSSMGNKYKTKEQAMFISSMKKIVNFLVEFHIADLYPSFKFLPLITGLKSKLEKAHKESDRILEIIIHQRKQANDDSRIVDDPEVLLDVLLRLQEAQGFDLPLTIDNIKAVMVELFAAGTDNTATTVDWAMSEMLKNPQILMKAQDEVRRVLDDKSYHVDESHLVELKYLKSVIKETLRLHPPGPLLLPRESKDHCVINSYEIPRKTWVLVNAWAIGRDPKLWDNAESFEPERFINSSVHYSGTDFQYIPFGGGRRICPGISHGIISIELQLATLLYHFDWILPGGLKPEEIDMVEFVGLTARRKNNLYAIPVVKRPLPVVD